MKVKQTLFNKTILIIEDSSSLKKIIHNELGHSQHNILYAETGESALLTLNKNKIDLIILDYNLPDTNGFDVLANVKTIIKDKRSANIPIILMTSEISPEQTKKAQELGVVQIIFKNKLAGNLFTMVKNILVAGYYFKDTNVLILDSSLTVRNVIKHMLADEGMNIFETDCAAEALALLADNFNIDMVILDKELPDMDGIIAVRKIRKEYPNRLIPILIMSAHDAKEYSIESIKAGASEFLTKPFTQEDFLSRIYTQLEIYHAETKLRSQSDELKDMMEFKDKFLSRCSNDMRGPITNIILAIELLEKPNNLDPKQIKLIGKIKAACSSLEILTQNISDLRRLEFNSIYDLKQLDISEVIISAIDSHQVAAIAKNLQLNLKRTTEKCLVHGDSFALEKMFNNLISTAVKFSPEGSAIEIEINIVKNKCVITITDLSDGNDAELGLSICKSVCEQYNANISIYRAPEKGTTITTTWNLV